jgi:U3 small nucleolar RNA-associated protein 3
LDHQTNQPTNQTKPKMGKKRKNTAKTGDKAMYKNRPGGEEDRKSRDDGDPIYNKVDAFHNEREEEYMGLDTNKGDSDDDDGLVSRQQHVMDLGVGGDSDESSASDEEESSDDDQRVQANPQEEQQQGDVSSSDDDDEEEEMDPQEMDPRNWGKKKSAYYHGDTADLEIGQEEDVST